LLYPEKTKNYHIVFYEFLLLPEGTMSTRAGKFVSVDDVIMDAIKEAEKTVNEKMPDYPEELKKKIARVVGIGALKYAMIKVSPEKTYAFNIKDTLKFEGDTAPYIQYTYARCKSILRKAKIAPKKFDVSDLKDEKEIDIIKKLAEFPETILKSAEDFRPHYIANYLYDLATLFNEFYHKSPVITADEKTKVARLALVESVSIIIKNGLNLLGIDVLEKM
jgi:arginyl-tRNA synthetase